MIRRQDRSRQPMLLPRIGLATATCLALSSPAQACRLALVLALDVSGSVSAGEDRQQRDGLAAALLAPEVRQAFLSGGEVAVYVFEWAGVSSQAALTPGWVAIQSETDLVRLAGVVAGDAGPGIGAGSRSSTAVGSALLHAAAAFNAGPDCMQRVVDVSGDGVNSQGVEPRIVIDQLFAGITVNALIIDRPIEDPMQEIMHGGDQQLAAWFEDAVVHGPGSFHIRARSYADYEQAMTAKLLREVQAPMLSMADHPQSAG